MRTKIIRRIIRIRKIKGSSRVAQMKMIITGSCAAGRQMGAPLLFGWEFCE